MSKYVALRAFQLGEERVEKGAPVPVIEGRNYQRLKDLGFIAEAPAGVGAPDPDALTLTVRPGNPAVFLGGDGELVRATFVGLMDVPEEAREGLGVEPGTRVAALDFGDENATLVCVEQVFPPGVGDTLAGLIARREGAIRKAADLAGEVRSLRDELARAQEEGANAQARVATLTGELEELKQRPALPPDALARLTAVSGIGPKLAEKGLVALTGDAPAAPPEG